MGECVGRLGNDSDTVCYWRRFLPTQGMEAGAGLDVLDAALREVTHAQADAPPITASA